LRSRSNADEIGVEKVQGTDVPKEFLTRPDHPCKALEPHGTLALILGFFSNVSDLTVVHPSSSKSLIYAWLELLFTPFGTNTKEICCRLSALPTPKASSDAASYS